MPLRSGGVQVLLAAARVESSTPLPYNFQRCGRPPGRRLWRAARQPHDDAGIHHAPLLPAGDAPREPTLLRHYAAAPAALRTGPRPGVALLGHGSTFADVPTLLNARVHNKQLWATDHCSVGVSRL